MVESLFKSIDALYSGMLSDAIIDVNAVGLQLRILAADFVIDPYDKVLTDNNVYYLICELCSSRSKSQVCTVRGCSGL